MTMTRNMRSLLIRSTLAAGLCLAAAACSKSDASKLRHDVTAVGHDVAVDVRKAPDTPQAKQAGAEVKDAAHKADVAVTEAGEKAKQQFEGATDQARKKVHDATADPHNGSSDE
jgi:hypothetical protein